MSELKDRWKKWWQEASVHNKDLVEHPTMEVNGMNSPRLIWRRIHSIRTGQGCCASLLQRWNIIESSLCQCGQIKTMDHIGDCPLLKFRRSLLGFRTLNDDDVNSSKTLNVEL